MHGVDTTEATDAQLDESGSIIAESDIDNAGTRDTAVCSSTVWLVSATVTIVSTRYLVLEVKGQHPYHLLLLHIVATLVLRSFGWVLQSSATNNKATKTPWLELGRLPWDGRFRILLMITCVAGALICSYQSLLHVPTLSTLLMVLTLDWRPEELFQGLRKSLREGVNVRWISGLTAFTVGVATIYLADIQLYPNGVAFSLLAAGFAGVGRLVHRWALEDVRTSRRSISVRQLDLTTLTMLGTLIPTIALLWIYENPFHSAFNAFQDPIALLISTCAGAVALDTGSYVFRRVTEEGERRRGASYCTSARGTDKSIALTGIVLASDSLLGQSRTSLWQYAGFAAATIAQWDYNKVALETGSHPARTSNGWTTNSPSSIKLITTNIAQSMGGSSVSLGSDGMSSDERVSSTFFQILAFASWALLLLSACFVTPSTLPGGSHPVLDTSFNAPRTLDLVIARYDEPAEHVASLVNTLLRLPNIASLQPRVVLYNKDDRADDTTFTSEFHRLLSAPVDLVLETRPNIGREGETYLNHIVEHWDSLANHTIFMQADVHNPWSLQRRVADYFLPTSGFLSLSFLGDICPNCSSCGDRAGWVEDPRTLHEIYRAANGGTPCHDLVLTYKGQFIASAARIRGNAKQMYVRLLRELVSPASDKHQPAYWRKPWYRHRVDSLNEPVFGFTLERMWGAMMQCSEVRVARRCPSLMSGLLGRRGPVEDCQCMDSG